MRKRSVCGNARMTKCQCAESHMSKCQGAKSHSPKTCIGKFSDFQKVWRRLGGGVLDSTQTKKCGAGGEGGRSRFPEPEKVWRR